VPLRETTLVTSGMLNCSAIVAGTAPEPESGDRVPQRTTSGAQLATGEVDPRCVVGAE
jgi:hypothetical protein